ncbi:late embryogenesis abundant protein At1g64065-like [Cornus florida]|uniref:late embryogenesis abundant protein At1g64065-like n=1 Tax=Cornus florida TaxID=4283 RepID=UPI00289C2817|nr:late embryogenesis abundant protein At1g64065-like [Cornus florida]
MAEKEQQPVYPLAPANGYARSDEEAAQSKELRRKKRMKWLAYGVAFVVFQTGIILLFALTVMKIKTPKFRVRSATFGTFTTNNASFDIQMTAELGVKNTNFGHYKFEASSIAFLYRDVQVGTATFPNARARARSTKKFTVFVDLSSTNLATNSMLGSDLSSQVLQLTSTSKLNGKVHLMKVIKKKKSTEMSCTMQINLSARQLQNVKCK